MTSADDMNRGRVAGRSGAAAMRLLALLVAAILFVGTAAAQDEKDRAREREIAAASAQLARFADDLAENGVDDPRQFEREVRAVIAASRERLAPVEEALSRAEDSLALLGSPPKEGEAPESAALAKEREALNSRISFLRGQRTRILASADEGAKILGDLSKRRLRDLYRNVLKRETPLLSPGAWSAAAAEAGPLHSDFTEHFSAWAEGKASQRDILISLAGLAAAFLVSFLMFGPVRDWSRRALTSRIETHDPTPGRRVAVAGVKMLTRLVPGLIGGVIVIETSRAIGLLGPEGIAVANAIWIALIAFLLVDGFTGGLFAPSAPAWRLAPVDAANGRRASALLVSIVVVVGAKQVISEISRAAGGAEMFDHVVTGAAAMLVGGLLFALCERKLWIRTDAEKTAAASDAAPASASLWPGVRFAGRILGVLVMAAPLAGHVNLADFVSTRLYYFALLLALAWFVRAAIKEAANWADRRLNAGKAGAAGKDENHTFRFWIGAGIDLALLMFLTPLLFILAGVDSGAVRDFFLRALVGFRIGGVFVSLTDIFFAIAAFVGILFLTRLLQGGLQRGPLAHSRIDPGIKNSLTTLFGYAGLIVAVLIALGFLGVNLTNLALIAGALSVGIGFGLQSIVNNFVSGLILLFERPIKVGDWIVTASGEGIVKKISVRSTELETFDRSAIIIPNSELVASTVTNWTHKSALGRIRVAVGVAYDSDPELVREILLKCANDHPLVVRYPEPFVVWDDFGASSLNFEIRAFLSDIAKGLQVRTDLRFAIFKAFKEQGVEIPFPQQDIHIRSDARANGPAQKARAAHRGAAAPANEPEDFEGPEDD